MSADSKPVPLPADATRLEELRRRFTETVARSLDGRRDAVLLDVPSYRNAGDLLITRGTLDVLRTLDVRVRLIQDWTLTSWSQLQSLPSHVAVLMHGGGNFGGLYPAHDDYRARVLDTIPEPSAAVVLPQSVHFPDLAAVERARYLYGRYPTSTFLIRDSMSVNALREAVPEIADKVVLCPDAAFGTRLSRRRPPEHDVFILQRRDVESAGTDLARAAKGLDFKEADWPSFQVELPAYRAQRKLIRVCGRLLLHAQGAPKPLDASLTRLLERGWQPAQRQIALTHVQDHVRIVEDTVSRGKVLMTDRLHGHVAATLMGVPNVALNNQDGKVGALVNEWTHDLATTRFAETPQEATAHVRDLLSLSGPPTS